MIRRLFAGRCALSRKLPQSSCRQESSLVQSTSQSEVQQRDRKPFRPVKVDPSLTTIILFPGHGAQFVGMGEQLLEIPNVQGMFESAKRILGYDLLDICLNGPESELNKTIFSHPAIYVASLGAIEKLRVEHPGVVEACVGTAGFGLGEIAALVFAGAFTFEDGLRLVKYRAEVLQAAAELVPSGMMTVSFGADARINFACLAAVEWCKNRSVNPDNAVCSIAAYLFPHCKILAGHEEALKFLILNGTEFGLRKCVRLNVSGAFHTLLMSPARLKLKQFVNNLPFGDLYLPVHSTLDCRVFRYEKQVRDAVYKSVTKPIKWEQVLQNIYRRPRDLNMPRTFICGGGESLLTVLRNVNKPAWECAQLVSL